MKNFQYILTHSSGNLTCEYNPLNWDKFNIVFKRSVRYHSILRSQVVDTEFPLDGKAYIDAIYAAYGIDTEIGCEIKYLNRAGFYYSTLFDGVIDLSEWTKHRDTTTVKINDGTVLSKFANNDELEIQLNRLDDLYGSALSTYTYLETVTVFGVSAESLAKYEDAANDIQISDAKTNESWFEYYGVDDGDYDFNEIGDDATLPDVSLVSASGPLYTNNGSSAVTVRFRIVTRAVGTITVTASNPWSWGIQVYTGKNAGTLVISRSESGSGNDSSGVNSSYDSGYITTSLDPGETIEIYHYWHGEASTGDTITPSFEFQPTLFEIYEVVTPLAETYVDMPMFHELGAKLLEIMTGLSDPLNAPILGRTDSEPRTYASDGVHSLFAAANGLMLRGYPHSDKPFETTFADFFTTLDALFNVGLRYDADNSEFIIADKADFFKVEKIITLGEVKDLEVSVAADYYFNKINAGYQKQVRYEEANGQQVPCVQTVFSNPCYAISNTLEIRSRYRGDDYGIEFARQSQYSETASEDTSYDNEQFILACKRSGVAIQTEKGSDFDTVENITSPSTRLNLRITPKRNMLNHANRLSIPLFLNQEDTMFSKSQYNLNAGTKLSGESAVIYETDDLAFSDLEQPLFYPELYTFEAELSIAMVLQLLDDPHGYVEFDYLGVTYSGYIIEVSSQPYSRKGNWTLIKRNPNRT